MRPPRGNRGLLSTPSYEQDLCRTVALPFDRWISGITYEKQTCLFLCPRAGRVFGHDADLIAIKF